MTSAEIQKLLDQAVTTLKQTTVGYAGHSSAWQQNQSTKWWQGLDKIRQAHAALDPAQPPPPDPDPDPDPPPGPQPTSSYLNNLGDFGRPAKAWDTPSNWHPDSARLVKYLTDNMAQSGRVSLALQSYGVVAVHAKASDPQVYITDTRGWGTLPKGKHGPFRCPASFDGASGTDGHIAIIQPDGSCWDMWRGRRTSATNFNSEATCLATSGQWNHPRASCRGSSFTLLSGVVAPDEVKAGKLAHALLCVMDDSIIKRGPVPPSNGSDGEQDNGVQEGMRFVLDPNVSLVGLTSLARTFAAGLQTHGMILGDRTSQPELSFIAVDPSSWTAAGQPDPWKPQGLSGYPLMNELIPLLRYLRVERW